MRSLIKIVFLLIFYIISHFAIGQKLDNGTYIAFDGGIIPKYAILTVTDDSASMEIFAKWQGHWLPAIGATDNSYKPQKLVLGKDHSFTNGNILVKKEAGNLRSKIKGIAKNTFAGKIKFKFKSVEKLPKKYKSVREKGLKFTKNKP